MAQGKEKRKSRRDSTPDEISRKSGDTNLPESIAAERLDCAVAKERIRGPTGRRLPNRKSVCLSKIYPESLSRSDSIPQNSPRLEKVPDKIVEEEEEPEQTGQEETIIEPNQREDSQSTQASEVPRESSGEENLEVGEAEKDPAVVPEDMYDSEEEEMGEEAFEKAWFLSFRSHRDSQQAISETKNGLSRRNSKRKSVGRCSLL